VSLGIVDGMDMPSDLERTDGMVALDSFRHLGGNTQIECNVAVTRKLDV
jgi:hypothetical protein